MPTPPVPRRMSNALSFASLLIIVVLFMTGLVAEAQGQSNSMTGLFADDFSAGLSGWLINDVESIRVIDSGDPEYGSVLLMRPDGAQPAALIRGSDEWRGYRIEGEVYFPENRHNYLGLIYNYHELGSRTDLGSIYIKGNGSYLRVNPRRDWNPSRQLYEEFRTDLTGLDAIRIGEWQTFAAEVMGNICHFYVGDMEVPKVTFDLYEHESGLAGFKPRVVGGDVWIDNIRAFDIDALSYSGPPRPDITYHPERLLTDWEVLGPFPGTVQDAERRGSADTVVDRHGVSHAWRSFETDSRGAVITGRVTDYLGEQTLAYFRTNVSVPEGESARIQFSSIDDMAIWVNGHFAGYGYRSQRAWYDFGINENHEPNIEMPLGEGDNVVVVRVRGGQYATGGFFARVERN